MRDEELEREPAGDAGTENVIEGRNAVIEALRAGKPIDKLFVLDGAQDGPIQTIKREAKKRDTMIRFVTKERLDQLSETGKHQGVIAYAAAYEYAEVISLLRHARRMSRRSSFCWTISRTRIIWAPLSGRQTLRGRTASSSQRTGRRG